MGYVLTARRHAATVVNDPARAPLDSGGMDSSNGLGLDYVSVAIGPDGTPWGQLLGCLRSRPAAEIIRLPT